MVGGEHDGVSEPGQVLESSNPRNIRLYERHGFRVTRVLDLPGGAPTATAMWKAQAG